MPGLGGPMLESGLVRAKNTSTQCLKNIGLYSIAGLMFWIIGYNIAYPGFGEDSMGLFGMAGTVYGMQDVGAAIAADHAAPRQKRGGDVGRAHAWRSRLGRDFRPQPR